MTRALGVEVLRLPSTSPANASWSFERKLAAWRDGLRRPWIGLTPNDDETKTDPELAPATISEHDGVRYLHLGTPWVQGAMRLKKPAGARAGIHPAHDGLDAAAPGRRAVFPAVRAMHTGDMYPRSQLPFIDTVNSGGAALKFNKTLQGALTIKNVQTVVGGHTPTAVT